MGHMLGHISSINTARWAKSQPTALKEVTPSGPSSWDTWDTWDSKNKYITKEGGGVNRLGVLENVSHVSHVSQNGGGGFRWKDHKIWGILKIWIINTQKIAARRGRWGLQPEPSSKN